MLYLLSPLLIINPRCTCAPRVTVVVCVCMPVKSYLTVRPENSVTYLAGNKGQKCVGFSETTPFKSYGVICLPATSYEGTAATYSIALFWQHSLLRVLKRLNNRLNTTWNTTGCKAASFFLFSLRLVVSI